MKRVGQRSAESRGKRMTGESRVINERGMMGVCALYTRINVYIFTGIE